MRRSEISFLSLKVTGARAKRGCTRYDVEVNSCTRRCADARDFAAVTVFRRILRRRVARQIRGGRLRLPERPEREANSDGERQHCHRLIFHRLTDGDLETARGPLNVVAGAAALFGELDGSILDCPRDPADLIGRRYRKPFESVECLLLDVCAGLCLVLRGAIPRAALCHVRAPRKAKADPTSKTRSERFGSLGELGFLFRERVAEGHRQSHEEGYRKKSADRPP